jgi:hypothetical protein
MSNKAKNLPHLNNNNYYQPGIPNIQNKSDGFVVKTFVGTDKHINYFRPVYYMHFKQNRRINLIALARNILTLKKEGERNVQASSATLVQCISVIICFESKK